MRHIRTLVAVALALSVFLVSETFAYWTSGGESASRRGYSRTKTTMESGYKTSWLLGRSVRNPAKEDLGSIYELLIAENGRIKYAVLDQGGVLGRGILGRGISDDLYAFPWSAINVRAHEGRLTLDVDMDRLRLAPTFKRGEWAKFDDSEFEGEVHGYYGVTEGMDVAAEKMAEEALVLRGTYLASEFMGKRVTNTQGEQLGRIRDLVAGGEGRIEYVIVSYGGGLFGMGGKLIPIPWKSVKVVGTDEYTLAVDMDKDRFTGAPGFSGTDWRRFDDSDWTQKIHNYFE
jgi:sporulation protein YlmC with PRC-barrel domain